MTYPSPTHHSLSRKVSIGLVALAVAASGSDWVNAKDRFLAHIDTPRVAGIKNFVATDRFRVGSRIGGRRLGHVGLNFAEHFLMQAESDAPAASLEITELRFTMGDTSIIKMLDVEKAPLAHLAHVHAIMEMAEAGVIHTDWRSNIAYVRSPVDNRLWAVHWTVNHAGEWTIGAVYVPHAALDWAAGTRVLSPELARRTAKAHRTVRTGE